MDQAAAVKQKLAGTVPNIFYKKFSFFKRYATQVSHTGSQTLSVQQIDLIQQHVHDVVDSNGLSEEMLVPFLSTSAACNRHC